MKDKTDTNELDNDIEHLEKVLKDFKGCEACKQDHERLLSYMKELKQYRENDRKNRGIGERE